VWFFAHSQKKFLVEVQEPLSPLVVRVSQGQLRSALKDDGFSALLSQSGFSLSGVLLFF
jgi:hypothetical protein